MLASDTYFTIAAPAQGLFKDKGSKFLGYAYPIKEEATLKQYIAELKKEHFTANHHCYAFMLGAEKTSYRASDDGEPSGTAGKPILGQIQSKNLTNIGIVVVRYFGGTQLGTSGLINAYRATALDTINNATIIEDVVTQIIHVTFVYEEMNSIMKGIKDLNLKILNQQFDNICRIQLSIRKTLLTEALAKIETAGATVIS